MKIQGHSFLYLVYFVYHSFKRTDCVLIFLLSWFFFVRLKPDIQFFAQLYNFPDVRKKGVCLVVPSPENINKIRYTVVEFDFFVKRVFSGGCD